MLELAHFVEAHALVCFVGYLVFMAAVQALPRPTRESGAFYVWLYQFANLLAVNVRLAMRPRKERHLKTLTLLLAAGLLAPAGLPAQDFSTPSAPPWRRVLIPCSATPEIDLRRGTAFQVTLCATAAAPVFSYISRADGKLVSMLVCQDAAGGRIFAWPSTVHGAADITATPNNCTAQTFLAAGTQLWATSTGASSSNLPAPSLLQPPLAGGALYPSGSPFRLANEPGGVKLTVVSGGSPASAFAFPWVTSGYGQPNPASGIVTTQISFWITQPTATETAYFGFAYNSTLVWNKHEFCGLESGGGRNHAVLWEAIDNLAIVPAADGYFLDSYQGVTPFDHAGRQLLVQLIQNRNTGIDTCRISADFGATWFTNSTLGNWHGVGGNTYWSIGGYFPFPDSVMHLTSILSTATP